MNARYYDAEIGRFITRDPKRGHATLPQTLNPYSYAVNNPVNMSDPTGEDSFGICATANAGIAGFASCAACASVTWDKEKGVQFGYTRSLGGGGTTGLATGVGLGLQVSNARDFDDLGGQDIFGGWSMLAFGVDGSVNKENPNIKTLNPGLSFGPDFSYLGVPVPFEAHGGSTYTWATPIKTFK
jgi:hypothetical protein